MEIALAILVPILALFVILATFWFLYVKQRLAHERQMLALQKGLPLPPEPAPAPQSVFLIWIAVLVPVLFAGAALGVTIWAATRPFFDLFKKTEVILVSWLVGGWAACVIVCAVAIIVVIRSFIQAARLSGQQPGYQRIPDGGEGRVS